MTVCQQLFSLLVLWRPAASFLRGRKKLAIPIAWHGAAALCSLGGCSLGNVALDLKLPLPLFFLMKCGSLVATMLVGVVIVGRSYSPQQVSHNLFEDERNFPQVHVAIHSCVMISILQVISVGCVTAGLMWATLVSNKSSVASAMASSADLGGPSAERIVLGALLVFAALVCTSIMGAVQVSVVLIFEMNSRAHDYYYFCSAFAVSFRSASLLRCTRIFLFASLRRLCFKDTAATTKKPPWCQPYSFCQCTWR